MTNMAGNKSFTPSMLLLVTVVLCSVIGICSAKSYVVGGSTGWTIPPTPSFYPNWASQQKFQVGDVLVFTFPAQAHTVTEVSKSNYDACTSAATLGPVMATAPANITLTKPGTHYFICTISGHCSANQKLTVTVAASTPAPVASPTPSPKSSPTRSPKSSPMPSPKASPAPSPKTSPTPSPSPTTSPSPSPSAPVPTVAPTPASGPGAKAPSTVPSAADSPGDSGSAAPPPAGNSAAATGVTLLSLLSIISFALLF